MKALSIKQPWAWLICAGLKDIENRNWRIGRKPQHGPYKSQTADFGLVLPQRIYVHAGAKVDKDAFTDLRLCWWSSAYILPMIGQGYADTLEKLEREWRQSALIGEVDIVDCVEESASSWFDGKYGFVLANPKLYDKPISCKGRLGFFEPMLQGAK